MCQMLSQAIPGLVPHLMKPWAASLVQLAPGWRAGANCDQYPRGDRRLGEACTDPGKHTIGQTSRLPDFRHMKASLREPCGGCLR
jgi:hypothetical protein